MATASLDLFRMSALAAAAAAAAVPLCPHLLSPHRPLSSPGIMQSYALGGACGVAGVSWWEWLIGAAASLVGGFFQYFGVEHQGVGQGVDQGVGRGVDQGGGQGGQGFEGFGDAMAGVVGGSDHGGGVGGVGMCACSSFGNARYGSPTSLKPLFNVFLAVWATVRGMQHNSAWRGRALDMTRKLSMRPQRCSGSLNLWHVLCRVDCMNFVHQWASAVL